MALVDPAIRTGFDRSVPALVMRADRNVLHHGTLGVIRSLGRVGIEVHALIEGQPSPSARSRYLHRLHAWTAEPTDPGVLLAELAAVSDRIGRRCLLVPVDDLGALVIAEHAPALADRFLLPAQQPAVARRLADKAALAGLCAELGLPHPEVWLPRSVGELADAVASLGLPMVAKWSQPWLLPPQSGLRSTTLVRSAAGAAELFARTAVAGSQLVLQRFLPPSPRGDWFYHGYLDGSATPLAAGNGWKERAYPAEAGLTTLGRWLPNPAVERLALRLLGTVGYRGIVDLDLRYDPRSGDYRLLDANPRLGAQFRVFVDEQALDMVRVMHLHLTERPVPAWRPRHGRSLLVENYDILSAAQNWLDGRLDLGGWRRSLYGIEERAWFAWDDPRPFAAMGSRVARQRVRRLISSRV